MILIYIVILLYADLIMGNIPFKYHCFNFNFIYWVFGYVSYLLKCWIDLNYKIVRITSQLQSLKSCKLHGVTPLI